MWRRDKSAEMLDLALDLKRVIAHQPQDGLDTLATLGTTAAGFIHVTESLAAGRGHGLLYPAVG